MRLAQSRSRIVGLVVAGLIAISSPALCASFIRGHIYKPDPMPAQLQWPDSPAPEEIRVRTDDGLELQGFRWPASSVDHVTLVFFHGNGGNRYTAARLAAALRTPDAEIIIASYRGYGGNPGSPSEDGLYRDGEAFVRLARQSSPRKLYLFGFSLGGAVALRLAADSPVDGVVTLGAFSSLDSVTPPLARGFLPDHFNNVAAVRRLTVPLLLLHGTADEVVPIAEGEKLKAAAGSKARFLRLEGAPHHVALDQLSARIWQEIGRMPPAANAPVGGRPAGRSRPSG